MKSNRVELLKWLPSKGENIEIDWPKVHKTIGIEQCRWLLAQPQDQCQIILERRDMYCRLVAEFYTNRSFVDYHLRWAK